MYSVEDGCLIDQWNGSTEGERWTDKWHWISDRHLAACPIFSIRRTIVKKGLYSDIIINVYILTCFIIGRHGHDFIFVPHDEEGRGLCICLRLSVFVMCMYMMIALCYCWFGLYGKCKIKCLKERTITGKRVKGLMMVDARLLYKAIPLKPNQRFIDGTWEWQCSMIRVTTILYNMVFCTVVMTTQK